MYESLVICLFYGKTNVTDQFIMLLQGEMANAVPDSIIERGRLSALMPALDKDHGKCV